MSSQRVEKYQYPLSDNDPTLEELLQRCRQLGIKIVIEPKEAAAPDTVREEG